ncbi:F-box/kelch-repeat protein [Fagus crenata]
MALKEEEKKQQAPAYKETKNSRPWPNLPHQLIDLIESQPTLEQGINFGSVTKSWRAAPKKCNPNATLPWLQISDTNTSNIDQQQRTMTKPYNSYGLYPQGFWWLTVRNQSRYPWKHYLGCTNGILVTYGAIHSIYFLCNAIQRAWYSLPPWDVANFEFKCVALSSSLSDHCNKNVIVMALTSTSHPTFMFHRLGIGGEEFEWIKQDCSFIDPHAPNESQKHYMQFTNVIGFRGKFYALTLQGTLAVIEEVDSHLKITSLGAKRAIHLSHPSI